MDGLPEKSISFRYRNVEICGSLKTVVNYPIWHCGDPIVDKLTAKNLQNKPSSAFRVRLRLGQYSQSCEIEVPALAPGSETPLPVPALSLNGYALSSVNKPESSVLDIHVDGAFKPILSEQVVVMSRWDWLIGSSVDAFRALAAFVSPQNWLVEEIARGTGGAQSDNVQEDFVLKSLYSFLGERCHIVYEPAYVGQVPDPLPVNGIRYQRVRRPSEILRGPVDALGGWATCLDLTILMAGCLERLGLYPLLILTGSGSDSTIPKHAFIGCWRGHYGAKPFLRKEQDLALFRQDVERGNAFVIECTGVTHEPYRLDFKDAQTLAKNQLNCGQIWVVDVATLRPTDDSTGGSPNLHVTSIDSSADIGGGQTRLEKFLRPLSFQTEMARHTYEFTGRKWLFDELDSWLRKSGDSRIFWLKGGPGVGKSAVVAELYRSRRDVVAVHFCVHRHEDKSDARRLVLSIAYQLAAHLDEYAKRLQGLNLEEETNKNADTLFENLIIQPLRDLAAPIRTLLVAIDAIDEATSPDRTNSIARLIASQWRQTPQWLKLFVTSRPEAPVETSLQGLKGLKPFTLHTESEDNCQDLQEFLIKRIRALGREPDEHTLETILKKSEGMFLYAVAVLGDLEKGNLSLDNVDAFPVGLGGYYDEFFARQFPLTATYERELRPILEAIIAQRHPLPLSLLAKAAGLDLFTLRQRLTSLGSLFPVTGAGHPDEKRETIEPWHKSVADWLTSVDKKTCSFRAGVYALNVEAGQAALAEACWKEYQQGPITVSSYALRHVTGHLVAVRRFDDLVKLLTDIFFLERNAEAGMAFALVSNFDEAVRTMPFTHGSRRILVLLEEALRRDINFIARHPSTLFQCLWNTCWWYDCPDAAKHYEVPEGGWPDGGLPWEEAGPKLHELLDRWRVEKRQVTPGFKWVRSLRPPWINLGRALRTVLRGHAGPVSIVSYFPDGRTIASGSVDRTIRFWDADTGKELKCFRGHEDEVYRLAHSSDGQHLASADRYNGTVHVWDKETGQRLHCVQGPNDETDNIAFYPDGLRIVRVGKQGTISAWDCQTGRRLLLRPNSEENFLRVVYSPDWRYVASVAREPIVHIWDMEMQKELFSLTGHEADVCSLSFSPNGCLLGTGDWHGTIRVWEIDSQKELACLRGHRADVWKLTFSLQGSHIASWARDGTMRLWDLGTRTQLLSSSGYDAMAVAFSPDGRRIVGGSEFGTLRVWDTETGQELMRIPGHEGPVLSVEFSPDGRRAVSSGRDNAVKVWEMETSGCLLDLCGHDTAIRGIAFSPDGGRIISTTPGSRDIWLQSLSRGCDEFGPSVWIWSAASGEALGSMYPYPKSSVPLGSFPAHSIAFSPDGCYVVVACDKPFGSVEVLDADTWKTLHHLGSHGNRAFSAVYSVDGRRIVSGGSDGTVAVWDAQTGRELFRVKGGERECVCAVGSSVNGGRVVSGGSDGTLRVWDIETKQQLISLRGPQTEVYGVAFSRAEDKIFSGGWDGTIRVWDMKTGECVEAIQGRSDIMAIAAGCSVLPYWLLSHSSGSRVVRAATREPVAWFPDCFTIVAAHPRDGRMWAAAVRQHLYLFRLETD